MDVGWRNTFGILMKPLGARPQGCDPEGSKIHFVQIVMLHIKSKVMKSRIQWCTNFTPGACLEVTRGKKVGFLVLFFIVRQVLLGFLS